MNESPRCFYRNNIAGFIDDTQMSVLGVLCARYDDRVVNPLVTGKGKLEGLVAAVINKYPNEVPIDSNWIISPSV